MYPLLNFILQIAWLVFASHSRIPLLPMVPLPPYIATNTLPLSCTFPAIESAPSCVSLRSDFVIGLSFKSYEQIQFISPSYKDGFPDSGVPPLPVVATFLIKLTFHSAGISPIHSMPLSFIGLSPRMPLVTACVMTACFSFLYSSIDARVFSNTVSISAHCASKNVTMRFCSQTLGNGCGIFKSSLVFKELLTPLSPI